jgi:hypothetical protein
MASPIDISDVQCNIKSALRRTFWLAAHNAQAQLLCWLGAIGGT